MPSRVIAVFATRRMGESGVYPIEIRKRQPEIAVVPDIRSRIARYSRTGGPRSQSTKPNFPEQLHRCC